MNFKKLHPNATRHRRQHGHGHAFGAIERPIGAVEDIGSLAFTGLHRRYADRNGGRIRQAASRSVTLVGDIDDDVNAARHPHSLSAVPRKRRIVSMNLATEIGFDR